MLLYTFSSNKSEKASTFWLSLNVFFKNYIQLFNSHSLETVLTGSFLISVIKWEIVFECIIHNNLKCYLQMMLLRLTEK